MANKSLFKFAFIFNIIFVHSILFVNADNFHAKPNATVGKDAYLSSFGDTTNYGTHVEFSGDAWTCNSNPCFARNVIQFDFTSIPAGSTINSATLSLFANPFPINGNGTAMQGANASLIQRVTSAWDESTVTWISAPTTTIQNEVTLAQSTSAFQNYPAIDVKDLVQDMVNDPVNSHGFMLRLINETAYATMIFASSDFPDSTKWPEITIDYTPPQDTCITYYAEEGNGMDAYLSSFAPDSNFANHEEFSGDAWTCNGNPCTGRGLLYFDIHQIPTNAVVLNANLSLYANPTPVNGNGVSMQGNNQAELLRVVDPWQENSVTWNTAPTTSNQNSVTLAQSTSSFQDYLNIDVTSLVSDMVSNPTSSYGFMLKLVTEVHYSSMIFASSDYPDSSKHPVLQVCYSFGSGINSILSDLYNLEVFPNPTTNDFNVRFDLKRSSNIRISISDLQGRLIWNKDLNRFSAGEQNYVIHSDEFSISNGLYILDVQSDAGHMRKKIVKE
ncbi:MAG: DNRLRE domain-containing protein [Bacteroidetes bacterium]|nr:DNRLRE domain-containing protein [Bacteroidota bacterium]